jgi:hypothetical protein
VSGGWGVYRPEIGRGPPSQGAIFREGVLTVYQRYTSMVAPRLPTGGSAEAHCCRIYRHSPTFIRRFRVHGLRWSGWTMLNRPRWGPVNWSGWWAFDRAWRGTVHRPRRRPLNWSAGRIVHWTGRGPVNRPWWWTVHWTGRRGVHRPRRGPLDWPGWWAFQWPEQLAVAELTHDRQGTARMCGGPYRPVGATCGGTLWGRSGNSIR